jgi:CheY-like chemotaxis protein
MRILVADDAPRLRQLVRCVLVGHQVVEAGDGDGAVQLVRTMRPEVAILDVNMPGRTGLEVCREIRRDPLLAATVVIVLTANGLPEAERAAFDAGADAFLTKPFSPRHLCDVIDRLAADAMAPSEVRAPMRGAPDAQNVHSLERTTWVG